MKHNGSKLRPLRVCVVDMNNAHVNQAMRCLRGIVDAFFDKARLANPGLICERTEVSPRDTQAAIPDDADLYLSSGGPGSPFDGEGQPWDRAYGPFVDGLVESAVRGDENQRSMFSVCYSFEMVIRHFNLARIERRNGRKFGVMPIYTTEEGRKHPLLSAFADRLFAFEHRNWEAIDLDQSKLKSLGGALLAQESRDGYSKGRAILGLEVTEGIEAVQFHPEADRAGVMNWISRPEQAAAFRATYGEDTYQAMMRTLDDPNRLAKTFALVIPGWMVRRFNRLSGPRGYRPLEAPTSDDVMEAFNGGDQATPQPERVAS